MMTSTCVQACIICDIDGFTGNNGSSTVQGVAPPDFCTSTVHNIQWIAFMAGSQDITLQVAVSGCKNNDGLEVGIYQSLDCKTFQRVSNCDGDIDNNSTATFKNIVPLTVGQYYYFVMDGNMGDICNYKVTVLQGTTNVSELTHSGSVVGQVKFCPGVEQEFEISPPTGATIFDWTLDGKSVGAGKKIKLTLDDVGEHQLCVRASNACDQAPPACTTLVVEAVPPQFFNESRCEGECLTVSDTTICESGNYEIHRFDAAGCDSAIFVSLKVFKPALTEISLNICDGDTVFVNQKPYFQTGNFEEKMQSWLGCDSTIRLDLQTIVCNIKGQLQVQNPLCFGGSGSLSFAVTNGTPPFNYIWQGIGLAGVSGSGSIGSLGVFEKIGLLPVGKYAVEVSDNFGNKSVLLGEITGLDEIKIEGKISDFNGFAVRCAGGSDGKIDASATGGKPPYKFEWSNGGSQNRIENLPSGKYVLTVSDANDCSQTIEFQLNEPEKIELTAAAENASCDGLQSGKITALATTGGSGGFEYALDGGNFSDKKLFENIGAGKYAVFVRDANGCTDSVQLSIVAPEIPIVELGGDHQILLGETVSLNLQSNVFLKTIAWQPPLGLSCSDCPSPDASPLRTTTYFVEVSSKDDCTAADSITVRVEKIRDIFVPNVFSPNDDGVNDFLTVFGSASVGQVKKMSVFSRWGELVFQKENFAANEISEGWDGSFRGKRVNPGLFSWLAEVEFLDGEVAVLRGSVAVVR